MDTETNEEEDGKTPEKGKTPTPYDALFKSAFGESESAADLIRRSEDLERIEAALDEILDAETKEQFLAQLK